MQIEMIDEPVRFELVGFGGVAENAQYAPVGLRLMNAMWNVVKQHQIPTTGINHWVYLQDGRMFVGVALSEPYDGAALERLESLSFELPRHAKHLHVGPYQELPRKWKDLLTELKTAGVKFGEISLEIYGHHCDDPAKLETTILIGLQ